MVILIYFVFEYDDQWALHIYTLQHHLEPESHFFITKMNLNFPFKIKRSFKDRHKQ